MQINTLYQLLAMRLNSSPLLDVAESLLMVPDLFHWLLVRREGQRNDRRQHDASFSIRAAAIGPPSCSSGCNCRREFWARSSRPARGSGRCCRPCKPPADCRASKSCVPGSHDTASAVMGVPAASRPGAEPDWCYISSGTWSLMGVETPAPVVTPQCQGTQFHERRGRGRHDAAVEKHLRPVDGAGMPPLRGIKPAQPTVGTI